jgi:hypothetical protein
MADVQVAVIILRILLPLVGVATVGTLSVIYILRLGFVHLEHEHDKIPSIPKVRLTKTSAARGKGDKAIGPDVSTIPRHSLILSLFSLVSLCFFLEGAILAFQALWYKLWVREDWICAIGGWALFGSVAVAMAWQPAEFGKRSLSRWYPLLVTWLALAFEVYRQRNKTALLQPAHSIGKDSESGSVRSVLHGSRVATLSNLKIYLLTIKIATVLLLALVQFPARWTSQRALANSDSESSPSSPETDSKSSKKSSPGLRAYIERMKIVISFVWPQTLSLRLVACQSESIFFLRVLQVELTILLVAFCLVLLAVRNVIGVFAPISLKWVVDDLTEGRREI